MRRSFGLSAAAAGVLLLVPAVASAENYLVTSCTEPLGGRNAAAGWVATTTPGGTTSNTCASGGALRAEILGATPPGTASAKWSFTAPPATRIVRALGNRVTFGFSPSNQALDVSYILQTQDSVLERCDLGQNSSCVANLVAPLDKQGLNGTRLDMRVLCANVGLTCSRPAGVNATHLWPVLEDASPPAVANTSVLDDGEVSGTLRARFDAGDLGGGVYRALVKVDGRITQAVPLGPPPCTDVNPRDADPYQFNVPVPCPASVTGAIVAVDVKVLPPGPHGVEIAVEDAAGNQKTVFGPIEFPKPNVASGSAAERAAALTGRLRMWFVKSRTKTRRTYTSRFGTRVVTRGRLRSRRGRGIVGARIDVYHIRTDGRRRLVKTGLKSRAGGALTLILPNNVDTRTLEFAYRALRPGPITSRHRLRLTVRTKSGRIYKRKSSARR